MAKNKNNPKPLTNTHHKNWKPKYTSKRSIRHRNAQPKQYKKMFTKIPLSSFCVDYLLLSMAITWSVVTIVGEALLMKTNISFARGSQLQKASWSEVGVCVHISVSVPDPFWLEPVLFLCLWPQTLWVHLGISVAVSWGHCLPWSYYALWLLLSFYLLFSIGPWTPRRFDEENPFRTECSKISHFLHIVQLWVFVLIFIYC